ncbi:MAG: aldehyde ferredoxin oxidoreductase family protein [Deltaproteobacteria bacterium]|nr:aldehyde ferredoxin oxidoreductase family protein [Deltaproteobacteria bacterium]MBW1936262.1 aldehyde ferredoxin oxidoreductase family protein [Deltaproteobacteria bacterium]MBW2046414.1 aldehyde ferredoxin oxidoreductase family protein [Deltaproteobacteria bacterium]
MLGFHGKILVIDLSAKSFEVRPLREDVLSKTLGGKGLASHLLLEQNPAGVDPLGPENSMILATGPVTGTPIWGSCRYGIFTKSPQTGCYSESYSGGTAAEYIEKTGYDAILLRGASDEPAWVEVNEKGAVFHSAQDLWGMETYDTEDTVKARLRNNRPQVSKAGVICIGPAGENQVSCAVIENDYWRSAGRTGVGAVLGSKKLKAMAFWGRAKKEIAEPALARSFARKIASRGKEDAGAKAYKTMGTSMLVDITNQAGCFPTHYWQKGRAEHAEKINASALHEHLEVTPHACLKCFMACGRLSRVREGKYKGLRIEGPEYETIYAFGGLCDIESIEEIAYLNDVCDRLGLDTITAGNLVAFTIEAARLNKVDCAISYGEAEGIAELLKDIAYRRGVGAILAGGIKHAAREWDLEDLAIHVKGLEPAGYDPRVLKGMGLAYGTSDRGACHLRATFYKPELSGMIDPDQIEGKAEMFANWEDRLTIFDTLILCRFYRDMYQWEELATIIKACTGLNLGVKEIRAIAGGITDDTRRFNIREGFGPREDLLPVRFYTEPLPETGKVITRTEMDQLLADYYKARGWDNEGSPPNGR